MKFKLMDQVIINSFQDLLSQFERQQVGQNMIFRGVSDSDYQLITSLGRCTPKRGTLEATEKRLLKLFKESSVPYIEYKPENQLEWMAVAQHYGLPTRLLDWSYNPLIATYFSVESNPDKDSAVYILTGCNTVKDSQTFKVFESKDVVKFRPPYISSRIQNQSGLFTVHPFPAEPFEHDKLRRVIIKKEIKSDVKKTLFKYGINQRMIYPGLEGISKDLKWLQTDSY